MDNFHVVWSDVCSWGREMTKTEQQNASHIAKMIRKAAAIWMTAVRALVVDAST